ncbi:MAG: anthrone oxygenase family protein [Parvibaculum sp.]
MSSTLIFTLTFAATLGSGLVAGIFYGFSSFIMGALGRLPAPQGIAAMHSINVVVINAKFFVAFFGTAALCLVLGVYALLNWTADGAWLLLAGAALYLVGCIGVTMGGNVPLNNALARAAPESAEGAALWSRYLVVWTRWNSVRTAASLAAAACFIGAMV